MTSAQKWLWKRVTTPPLPQGAGRQEEPDCITPTSYLTQNATVLSGPFLQFRRSDSLLSSVPPPSRPSPPPPPRHPRQPSSHQLPQPHLHPTSVLSRTPLVAAYLGHIVFHLIQVSVFQGPHELLVAHHCSGAGRSAGQKTRRRW